MYKYNLITMKRTDFYFCLIVVALFAPFVLSPSMRAISRSMPNTAW